MQRLQAKVIKIVDISYGGENGFNQAIELASGSLANVKFIQEKKLIGLWFHFNLMKEPKGMLGFVRCSLAKLISYEFCFPIMRLRWLLP